MINVTLVGKGNLSSHLEGAFSTAKNVLLKDVVSSRANTLETIVSDEDAENNHIYIIAVSDDAISSVSQKLIKSKSLIAHTSGSVALSKLPKGLRRGVFYPLQTFSKERKVDFKTVPFCIEAENNSDLTLLKDLASTISDSIYEISSEQRKSLHLAAVFANNFTNHLYQISKEICKMNEIPFDILKPLIKETALKIENHQPAEMQTGPAVRYDQKTIEKHLEMLNNENYKKAYQLLTKSIQKSHEH